MYMFKCNRDLQYVYRNIEKMNSINNGNRTLFESIIEEEIITQLIKLTDNNILNYVMVGRLALSYYAKPMMNTDIDLLFLSENDIPENVDGFRRINKHHFYNDKTGIEIKLLTPNFLNIHYNIIKELFNDIIVSNNIRIVSVSSLIVLKLFRFNLQDQADIGRLIKYAKERNQIINLDIFDLSSDILDKYNEISQNIDKYN